MGGGHEGTPQTVETSLILLVLAWADQYEAHNGVVLALKIRSLVVMIFFALLSSQWHSPRLC